MPEQVCANVDFLSGDLNPMNSFNSARYAARALAQQKDYAWDLMSWNFRISVASRKAYVQKHPIQVMQEASAVIAVGGAYQNYIPQCRDGAPKMWELESLTELSEFVLARKPFCHRATQVHQVALLLSTYDRRYESEHLFSRTGYEKTMGLSSLLCDIGQSLEIVCEHTLEQNISEYKMIVIPELYYGLDEKTIKTLLTYAENGGSLVLVGKNTCSIFSKARRKNAQSLERLQCCRSPLAVRPTLLPPPPTAA
jgi:thymidine kinase